MWVEVRALRMFNLGTRVSGYFHFQVAGVPGTHSTGDCLGPTTFGEDIIIAFAGCRSSALQKSRP